MKGQIEAMMRRVKATKGIDARKFVLNELGPILMGMAANQEAAIEATDKNFSDIYTTLNLGMDQANFLEHTKNVITGLSAFVDTLLIDSGYFESTEGGLTPTEKAPDAIKETLNQQMEVLENWYEQADILLIELAEEDIDDEEELDDDEDDEELDEDGSPEEPETMPAPTEEVSDG